MKDRIILLIILMFCNYNGWSQKEIQFVKVLYVNFLTMTDADVSCSDFESVFKYKSIEMNDPIELDSIQKYISCFKFDSINNNGPDTRAKIIIYYNSRERDTICLSNFRISFNGVPIINDIKFTKYIKNLVSRKCLK